MWYRIGTVAVTNGSKTVTGTGTAWMGNVQPSDEFEGPDGKRYEVDQVVSNTGILLVENYGGTTASGGAYKIIPTQGRVRDLTAAVLQLVNDYGSIEAALTVLAGNVGLGKTPNASAKLDVAGQVWIDAPSGDATLRLLASGTEKGKLAVTSAGRAYIESNGAEVMTWLNGNVGVGTTTPANKLHINGGVFIGGPASLPADAAPGSLFSFDAPVMREFIGDGTGYSRRWSSRAGGVTSDRMTVTDAGNVGIGTTAPATRMEVSGATTALRVSGTGGTPATLQLSSGGVVQWNLSANQDGGAEFGLSYSSTRYLTVTSGGNVGIGTASPQARLEAVGGSFRASHATNTQWRGLQFGIPGDPTQYGSLAMELQNGELRLTAGFTAWGGFQTGYTNGLERTRLKATGQFRLVPMASDPAGGEGGDLYFNGTTGKFRGHTGGGWVDLH